ncbi:MULTISPECIES: tyrosine-type recombinase/integrase [unclassified Aeromicrobium]|uniref:tyrosine-type recombinase/integrase n=1 Tax=unclassified Aeromicrobium TaxID=2633570 RepID=UPI00396AF8AF
MASKSIAKRDSGKWRARFRDDAGKEHARHFDRKIDAQQWLDKITADLDRGTYVAPKDARITVGEWCERWLAAYSVNRASTIRQARTHLAHIETEFGARRLAAVKPTDVRAWIVKLQGQNLSQSYIYALHRRLSQIYTDAIHDDLVAKNPCSRRTSPRAGGQKPYVATTEQVWALHDAMPAHLRATVLLGAFVGLRNAEVCGLAIDDLDYLRGLVKPRAQYPDEPLKTETSKTPVPIPRSLAKILSTHAGSYASRDGHLFRNEWTDQLAPRVLDRAFRNAREVVAVSHGLPLEFRFHDLRHYYASLLIASGADVKVVQARLRHKSAKTTLDVYGHLWPDSDDSTRAAIDGLIAAQVPDVADYLRTGREVTA